MTTKVFYPWFKSEDVDGFFSLFQNNLANFAFLVSYMMIAGFPLDIVSRMVMGAAIAVAAGNFYYAHMANKLAQKEGRSNVTALSYGISTPVQFIYMALITNATLQATGSHDTAWKIGVAACMLGGMIEAFGGLIGRWVRANLPRAAMLGALAGVAMTFIAGEMYFRTNNLPLIGTISFIIIAVTLIAKVKLPFKIPGALAAIVLGTIGAYALGYAKVTAVVEAAEQMRFVAPLPTLAFLEGFKLLFTEHTAILALVIPISVYNFVETMNNVEAVAALGDNYDVREAQFADGAGTMIGALFGGILPTTVYIASVGSKEMNAGRGYSILNGGMFLLAALLGAIVFISRIIPLAVIAPILVYVGVMMMANAFTKSPAKHAAAVAVAMLPYLANYINTRFGSVPDVIAGRVSPAVPFLSHGAMFTALLWGAIVVFLIDKEYMKATWASLVAAFLAFIGIMHHPRLQLLTTELSAEGATFRTVFLEGMRGQLFLAYIVVAITCWLCYLAVKANVDSKKDIAA